MPEKEGDDEKKSTKSVVNKKQKQFMNQEDYIPEKLSPESVNRELDKMDVRDKNRKPLISKEKSDSIQAKDTFKKASEYATKQRPKIGGGERPDLKSKGGSASTGESDIKIGGPKKDPKSAGGKSKGNTPVKVDIKKKPDLSKYFGDEYIPEEGYDIARDMGKVRPSKNKKDATTMPPSKEMRKTQKVNKGPSALERVKAKYGKSVMNVGKKKVKEELDLTKVAEAFGGYIIEQEDSGRRTIQQYIDAYNATNPEPLRSRVSSAKRNTRMPNKNQNDEKPKITGDTDAKDSGETVAYGKPSKVTTGKELKKRALRKGVDYFFDPKKAAAERERTVAKRKEYEIDDKGNVTDAGVEKYARRSLNRKQIASGSNEPIKLSQSDLDKAREDLVGGKEVKDSKGKVIGKTTGKYGGTMPPQASEKEMKQTKAYLKKRGLKTNFIGDKEPDKVSYNTKDRVTVNTSDTDKVATPKPKPSKLSMVGTALKKSPVTPLIAYDIGKGIFSKIMKLRMPAVQGGKAGFRSAGR